MEYAYRWSRIPCASRQRKTTVSLCIRRATRADPAAIAKVHVASWQQAYRHFLPADYLASLSIEQRRLQWVDAITAGINGIFVAELGGELIGFSCIGPCRDEGATNATYEILAIYVNPANWTQGVGRELWLASLGFAQESRAERVSLWVFTENARAISFYQAAGFVCEEESLTTFEIGGINASELRYVLKLN